MIVTFTGHRPSGTEHEWAAQSFILKAKLKEAIINHEADLVNTATFKVGGAPGFDTIALEVLIDLKVPYENIWILVPFDGFEMYATKNRGWNAYAIAMTGVAIKNGAQFKEICNDHRYNYGQKCYKRNEALVNKSDVIFTNWDGAYKGGTYHTVTLAKKAGLKIINISQE